MSRRDYDFINRDSAVRPLRPSLSESDVAEIVSHMVIVRNPRRAEPPVASSHTYVLSQISVAASLSRRRRLAKTARGSSVAMKKEKEEEEWHREWEKVREASRRR